MSEQTSLDHAKIHTGEALTPANAIESDCLERKDFARAAVRAVRSVGSTAGLVVSIEGAWGSGKTSVLSLIEAYLHQEPAKRRPVIVHFNPWLVGERDALLKLFLQKLATAASLTNNTEVATRAAQQLRAYSRIFGVLKFIPGSEPWASITERVISASGGLTESAAKLKAPDLEGQRDKVAAALRDLSQPIIVFIDDIDRLFAQEVFEVVRIIKAVGELPNVGYVVAWDADYVTKALDSLNVPFAATYLDKVVQVRLPLPAISRGGREHLLTQSIESLGEEVTRQRFRNEEDRLSLLYWSGLRELLAYPRDFTRVFNTLRTIEPLLRGEVAFADLLGLATLKVKAPSMYNLIHQHPEYFSGSRSSRRSDTEETTVGVEARAQALSNCASQRAVKGIVHFLFPHAASDDNAFTMGNVVSAEGHLAAPDRLALVLNMGATDSDVSMVAAVNYLVDPTRRNEILKSLTILNCVEFLRMLGEVIETQHPPVSDAQQICIDIAKLVDHPVFIERRHSRRDDMLMRGSEDAAVQVVGAAAARYARGNQASIAESVVSDAYALTVAARLLAESYLQPEGEAPPEFSCSELSREMVVGAFAKNVLEAANTGTLLSVAHPASILWRLQQLAPATCPAVFAALRDQDLTLDSFALEILRDSFHSPGGQAYAMNEDAVAAYCDTDELREHAKQRITDGVELPALAAWRSVVDGKRYFGKNGKAVRD